jgi:hypothetical protein
MRREKSIHKAFSTAPFMSPAKADMSRFLPHDQASGVIDEWFLTALTTARFCGA